MIVLHVIANGGTLRVETKEGESATFIIDLPLEEQRPLSHEL